MSNSPNNKEQNALFTQSPTQLNPGAARVALLAEADNDGKSKLNEPIPERNKVPPKTR
jgi:hypothetical protein